MRSPDSVCLAQAFLPSPGVNRFASELGSKVVIVFMILSANRRLRIAIALGLLVIGSMSIGFTFWNQEMRYRTSTPVPENYSPVPTGTAVNLPSELKKGKAWFLHFYSPDCPCSRFNAQHLRKLIGTYNDSVSIAVVVPSTDDVDRARKSFGDRTTIITDSEGAIALACGVYSTPQAAIVDRQGKLYYRGNYNVSRYCTSRATNFAELSLLALLNNQPSPQFGLLATESYGCSLEQEEPTLTSLY